MRPATLSGRTRLVCILADPVGHVLAPGVYNPAFAEAGLDWCMVPMGVAPHDLAATVRQLALVSNLQGLNITIPHKAAAYALCARLGPEARRTGVVNTLRHDADDRWTGESFDGTGFVDAAQAHGLLPGDGSAAIVGAGGAGTAIAFALAAHGMRRLDVVDRDAAKAEQLVARLRAAFPALHAGTSASALGSANLVVNATPLGMHAGDALPFDPSLLAAGTNVFDIVAARDTELVAACRARGLVAIGGRPMIEHQLAAQIAFWRGTEPATEASP